MNSSIAHPSSYKCAMYCFLYLLGEAVVLVVELFQDDNIQQSEGICLQIELDGGLEVCLGCQVSMDLDYFFVGVFNL